MKAILSLATSLASVSAFAQVAAPSAPVSVPAAPVTAPGAPVTAPSAPITAPGTPNIAAQPGALINPAVPTGLPPQAVGRTFQTPILPGAPGPVLSPTDPNAPFTPALGVPPVSVPGGPVGIPNNSAFGITNGGFGGAFTNVAGAIPPGGFVNGASIGGIITNIAPPIANPSPEPVTIDLPPGSVVGTSRPTTPNTVGTPTTPGVGRPFPNTVGNAAGSAQSPQRGTSASRPPSVVRPQ